MWAFSVKQSKNWGIGFLCKSDSRRGCTFLHRIGMLPASARNCLFSLFHNKQSCAVNSIHHRGSFTENWMNARKILFTSPPSNKNHVFILALTVILLVIASGKWSGRYNNTCWNIQWIGACCSYLCKYRSLSKHLCKSVFTWVCKERGLHNWFWELLVGSGLLESKWRSSAMWQR